MLPRRLRLHPLDEQTLIDRAKSYPQMGLRCTRVIAYCLPNFRNVFSGALVHLPMGEYINVNYR